jgi:BolA protein
MVSESIKKKILGSLNPEYLKIIDESHKHASHYESAKMGETHFLIEIKASELNDLSTIQKHKKMYAILDEEIKKTHAVSIRFLS